jgi:hypothetical protein
MQMDAGRWSLIRQRCLLERRFPLIWPNGWNVHCRRPVERCRDVGANRNIGEPHSEPVAASQIVVPGTINAIVKASRYGHHQPRLSKPVCQG